MYIYIYVVFKYSDIKLTESMLALLNRTVNFSVLPLKLDITQVLVDFNRFSRAVIWQEYWFRKEVDEVNKSPIFKKK